MKILVVGAGGQGAPCASILAHDPAIEEVILGDIDPGLVERVKGKIGSEKVSPMRLDASQLEQLERAADGVDVVVNLTLIRFNPVVMQAALNSGAHYVDTAFDEPHWTQLIKHEPLYMDEEFEEAGLTALIGCGFSPGVTNVMAKFACEQLDQVDEIRIKLGRRKLKQDLVRGWDPGWSPAIALTDYHDPAPILERGRIVFRPPFSEIEEFEFPAPVGKILVSHHCHEEAVMLARFIQKGLSYCDFKYPFDPIAAALVEMGFASVEPVDVDGVEVSPLDVIRAMVPQPANAFFDENIDSVRESPEVKTFIIVDVEGRRAGKKTRIRLTRESGYSKEDRVRIFQELGSCQIYVALPAVVGAKLCSKGAPKGVIGPECIDPTAFIEEMEALGVPFNFEEEHFWEGNSEPVRRN